MEIDESEIRLHSLISRTILRVNSDKETRLIGRMMGISDEAYVDFVMGIMYAETMGLFRKESGLDEKSADAKFIGFWKKEGNDIRTRLIQKIEG